MNLLLTLGFGFGLGLLWLVGKTWRDGESPFDRLPAGVSRTPLGSKLEQVADGTRYLVYFWPADAGGRTFHVATVKGSKAWVSFWLEPTGKRTLYQSLASAGELVDLRKDWAL